MPFGLNNPLPSSMRSECKKAGKILASFVDPRQAFGPDKVIPPQILANAKGLAIITVFKAAFLGSARGGSGVVVARLADRSWSAPSAIVIAGGGFGGQVGLELTDFVFILNDDNAVKTFSQQGSLALSGNISIAAGPVGRNAEAAGQASLKSVSAVFAYSKTKGLFAGVSLEGSVLRERRDGNEKLYNRRLTAKQLLEGEVRPPPAAEPLMRVLNSRIFSGVNPTVLGDDMYNDVPVYEDRHDDVVWEGRRGEGFGEGVRRDRTGSMRSSPTGPKRHNTWQDDVYDRQSNGPGGGIERSATMPINSNKSAAPPRPTTAKPVFRQKQTLGPNEALATYTFDADQPGDLAFKKGDVITIVKRTENMSDWWTGRIGEREGIFPRRVTSTSYH
ncbi:MAG: hypothetical protein M1837_002393 [Sclerophora amabilis]|nr:MAG: hypothetical protein M1837_002393 [Sclerophora amabilis]